MGSFTDVTNGGTMSAANLNQLIDSVKGTTVTGIAVNGGAPSATPPIGAKLPSGVTAGSFWYSCQISGDTKPRVGAYINGSGFASLAAGPGGTTAATAHMEGSASGWTFLENVIFSNGTTIGAASTWGGATFSGTVHVTGTTTLNGGSGTINAPATALAGGSTWTVGVNGSGWFSTDTSGACTLTPVKATSGAALARGVTLNGLQAGGTANPSLSINSDGSISPQAQIKLRRYGGSGGLSGWNRIFATIAGTSATLSHGLSATPNAITASTGTDLTPSSWAGVSVDSYGSSTCTIHVGASGFQVMAIVYNT